jgi:hypothetical protein
LGDAGSPYGRFKRALERGNVLAACAGAAELAQIPLEDALALSLLLLDKEPRRYERAAARVAALYVERVPVVRLDELAAVVALLSGLRGPDAPLAASSLAALWRQRELAPLVRVVERWEPVSA